MSLLVVPPAASSSKEAHIVSSQATAHPVTGTHDAFRYGLHSAGDVVAAGNVSPLQARLEKWATTQQELRQTMDRKVFGLAVPLRQAMEQKIVSQSLHHPLFLSYSGSAVPLGGSSNLQLEILQGNDETLDAGDFMAAPTHMDEALEVSVMMEKSRGI